MPLRVFVPRVLRLVAVATVGHARGFMLIAQQPAHKPYGPRAKDLYLLLDPVSGSMVGGSWMNDGNFKSSVCSKLLPLDQRRQSATT
jgi:hypothetical protein